MCDGVGLGQIRFLRFVVPGDYQGEALGQRAPLLTSELFAVRKVEIRNSLW